jgi:succinate dehydrogenase / fumarate reductase cytochrome b subunit
MSWLSRFLQSTIGQKIVMALTGLALVGFVIAHMLGNLQIFLNDGGDALNSYAATLQGNRALLWSARSVLLVSVFLHIWSALKLTRAAKSARPVSYKKKTWFGERYAVRTMRVGGFIVLAFIVYHLLHFTVGTVHSGGYQPCDTIDGVFTCYAYENVISGFSNPLIGIFYIVAQVFLGMHLTHGVWSMTRTLGQGNPRFDGFARKVAIGIGLAITIGNSAIPLYVMMGCFKVVGG